MASKPTIVTTGASITMIRLQPSDTPLAAAATATASTRSAPAPSTRWKGSKPRTKMLYSAKYVRVAMPTGIAVASTAPTTPIVASPSTT